MKIVAAILLAFGLALGAASAEAAQDAGKRVALVLGNGAYAHAPALPNPRRDAEAMGAALERLGFEVELGVDLDLAGMRRAVLSYARKLDGAEVALFYYAGHGMQVHGQNYLLPVDADVSSEVDLDFAAMPARLVLAQMERWPATKIVVLDACRDNPFATALSRSMGKTRAAQALDRGLAQIEAAGGTLLAYATDPGDVAADGAGENSPFTDALLKHVETPGVEIHTMLARVRADVYEATGRRQRPWTESSLIGEFFLAHEPEAPPVTSAMLAPQPPAEPAPPPSSGLDPRQIELAVWEAAQAGGTAEDYAEYLRQYPDGIFAKLARNRLAALTPPEAPQEAPPDTGAGAPDAQAALPEPRDPPPGDATEPPSVPEASRPPAGPPGGRPIAPDAAEPPARPETADGQETADPEVPQPPDAPDTAQAPETARAAAAAEEKLGLSPPKRREVQARLLVAGHDPRGVDGIFGPGTRSALIAWQAAQGLAETGYLDAAALDLLERGTERGYAVWVERQRAEEEARRAAAARARSERQAARAEPRAARAETDPEPTPEPTPGPTPEPTRARSAPEAPTVEAPALAEPAPETARSNPLAPPPPGESARDRYEQDCYFITTGVAELKRICN